MLTDNGFPFMVSHVTLTVLSASGLYTLNILHIMLISDTSHI